MKTAALDLEFEKAALISDHIIDLRKAMLSEDAGDTTATIVPWDSPEKLHKNKQEEKHQMNNFNHDDLFMEDEELLTELENETK